jgi:hypothetical protein
MRPHLCRAGNPTDGVALLYLLPLGAKRLELLREMVPSATRVTVLVDPTFPLTEALLQDIVTAAPTMGLQIQVLNVSTSNERSMRPSQPLCASGQTLYLLALAHFWPTGVSSWSIWRRGTPSQRYTHGVNILKSAG